MTSVTLTISKVDVRKEVQKTAEYVGQKMTDETDAYDRIRTTDADDDLTDRYWSECTADATETFKPFLSSVTNNTTTYEVTLSLSPRFDTNLQPGMQDSLRSYIVNGILSKWFIVTNKKEAETYAAAAESSMKDIVAKMFYKKKPTRTTPMAQNTDIQTS